MLRRLPTSRIPPSMEAGAATANNALGVSVSFLLAEIPGPRDSMGFRGRESLKCLTLHLEKLSIENGSADPHRGLIR